MARQANSQSFIQWIYWMVIDILKNPRVKISYGYLYYDRKKEGFVVRKHPIAGRRRRRFLRVEAWVDVEKEKIFINHEAEDQPLCLFHECLEILFACWADRYFVPQRWGLSKKDDPILYLEAATWGKLSKTQKQEIAKYLPKGP